MGKGKNRQIQKERKNIIINRERQHYLLVWETKANAQAEEVAFKHNKWQQRDIWRLAEILMYDTDFNEEDAWNYFECDQRFSQRLF